MDTRLTHKLKQVQQRINLLASAWCILLLATFAVTGFAIALQYKLEPNVWQIATGVCVACVAAAMLYMKLRSPKLSVLARRIEQKYPALNQSLVTAIDPRATLTSNAILGREVREQVLQHERHHHWVRIISGKQIVALGFCNAILFLSFFCLLVSIATSRASGRTSLLSSTAESRLVNGVLVEPGSVEVERGSALMIAATFEQPLPFDVQLSWHVESVDSSEPQMTAMQHSLNDPIFATRVDDIQRDFKYSIVFDGNQTERFTIKTFDYPRLVRSDATLTYPAYTQLPKSKIDDTKRVRIVEGTHIRWQFFFNKKIATCSLINEHDEAIAATISQAIGDVAELEMTPLKSGKYKLQIADDAGRRPKLETNFYITVVANLPPTIKLTAGADVSVSALQEWSVAADMQDDYEILQHGVSFNYAGQQMDAMTTTLPAKSKINVSHRFNMEALQAHVDDLISYWFWAEDYDANGNVRRTQSDLFFAEVRPFEEVYRQGQSPTSQQQQQQQQSSASQKAEELLELQKQVLAATWKLQGVIDNLTNFDEDRTVIADSQTNALDKLQELIGELQDIVSREAAAVTEVAMQDSITHLNHASTTDRESFARAVAAQQIAYAGLLKLRAREHEITQSQQNQSQSLSSSSQQKQQQIDQLKLEQNEDRYETQSQAQAQTKSESQQAQQTQERLKELATRQSDLNEQIAQLENALQNARSPEEQQDLQDQLKRLRDSQQDLLQDADELLEQMQQQQQTPTMEQATEQTQQARENIQHASESLQQGKPSEALAAGTRAEQAMKKTEQELRQQSASGLSDSLREMRTQAEDLARQQERIRDAMQTQNQDETAAGLRPENSTANLPEDLQEQRQALEELQKHLQQTVLNAEQAEPLVADALYKAYQQTQQERTADKLQAQAELLDRAMQPQAEKLANQTLNELKQLSENISEAGQNMLGSDVAQLERAAAELQQLAEKIAQQTGQSDQAQIEAGQADEKSEQASAGSQKASDGNAQATEETETENPAQRQAQAKTPGQGQSENPGQASGQNKTHSQARGGGENSGGGTQAGNGSGLLQQLKAAAEQQQNEQSKPLTGDTFSEFNQTLRDVEQLLPDAQDRATAAGVRQAARQMRAEFKRHAKEPDQELVQRLIATPVQELIDRVAIELQRKNSDGKALVPLDRDPVPSGYEQAVQTYYKNLGASQIER